MSLEIRRTIPLAIAALTGLLMVIDLFFVNSQIAAFANTVRDWAVIIAGFTICLGGGNIILLHGNDIRKRVAKKWYYSALLLIVMTIYTAVGLGFGQSSSQFLWLFNAVNFPLAQTIFALLAFYIFSAAIRAFQARNFESTIFLVCALFVVIGNIPFVPLLSSQLGAIGPWITNVPTRGAFRGLLITAAIGMMILGLRTLLGRETAYLGRV